MKILQINATSNIGSTGRIAKEVGDVIRKNGDKSYIGYGYYLSDDKNSFKIKSGNSKYSLYYELIRTRITGYHGFAGAKRTRKFIRWIEEVKPDIIHLHNLTGGYIHVGVLFDYLKKSDTPVVWTLHDCWSFTGHCTHFTMYGCEKWKTGCYECPDKDGFPKRWFFDRSKEQWEWKKELFSGLSNVHIITPSMWLSNLVEESYLGLYPRSVIYNGIDLEVFKPIDSDVKSRLSITGKKMVLAVASSWSERKGFNYILQIGNKLRDDHKLVVVGLNNRQMEMLPDNIIGIMRTNDVKELAELYSASDVFINPTLEEVLGLTNLESQACGTPVVTFNTGGSVECISEETGLIVEKKDVDGMLKAIYSLTSIDKKPSDKCVSRVQELFGANDRYNDYYKLYRDILKK